MLQRPIEPKQYTSFRFTQHLIDAGIDASVGTVGDALDNALAESMIGLYKTELIKPQGPWHDKREFEKATAAWVEWYNNQRLHEACSCRPPTEFETLYEQGDLASLVARPSDEPLLNSGRFTHKSGSSIKGEHPARTGNRKLKRAFFLAAFAALHDPTSRTYYDRKRAEGKKHNAALICLARRRCDVLFAMLRNHTHYRHPEPVPTTAAA
ncbi:hypothetical protein GCM10009676_39660 [Prauserella halophila]|uniref:Transposase n=1 Tax=Prauserella halophila TaxID=185641 RepID=A0ABP4H3P6_9PSEU|nr:Transposase IS116/IS110/IS902 family protein [Prauserella halophila]